ncbi:multidrug effflux MFS transporter [Acrocarpospora macrocephala]|uniref:Putative multidrug resistance transporter, Bcr/CflA family protein n=1 Tax=Acrocarpospora macrocephala TaxID=150177 RepID=A0A5M3WKA9_9ACTN|nr:multidrug effflux MFS transporter [Acrocarpospora macrocephala]GES08452.1 putative multidrug resistance transporter, Bcr/CflA family protein [Acrocarpospora macrocephala]
MSAEPEIRSESSAATGWQYVRLVLLLGCLTALPPLSVDLYLPALPQVRDDLQATDSMTQLTFTGMLLGMGLGQLIVGPLSDAVGRRPPLLFGLLAHASASLLCAVAPNIEVLAALRLLQGLSAAAVSVVIMATIRDRFQGTAMARIISRNMLVVAMAPILAPSLGSQLLRFTDWRGIFATLLVIGLVLALGAFMFLDESLPRERRRSSRPRAVASSYLEILRDRTFISLAMIGGLTAAAVFSYIGASSFVFQDGFGLSEQEFGLVFGINAILFLAGAQLNPLLISRFPLIRVMMAANLVGLLAALSAVVLALGEIGGPAGAAIPMGVVLFTIGMVLPNTPALALHRHGVKAGLAAAVLGCLQSGTGGLVAPLVGAIGVKTALPLSLVMTAALVLAGALLRLTSRDTSVYEIGGHKS